MKMREHLILAVVIVVLGLIFQGPYLNHFPLGHHSWTQTDHYALSLKFIENGFDFFHPETYNYPRKKINGELIPSSSTVSAVDFPIHQYAVAWIMFLTGDSSSLAFKIYTLLYSFLGLFFFGKIVFHLSQNFDKVIVAVALAATAPVFIYFQQSMMPTIPSWSNAIIGIYFWMRSYSEDRKGLLTWALFFLTLAALARTTYALLLIALFTTMIINRVQLKRSFTDLLVKFGLAGLIVVAYYGYNSYLRAVNGSIFLSTLLPPSNFQEAIDWIKGIIDSWSLHYISIYHYPVVLFILITGTYFTLRKKVRIKPIQAQTMRLAVIWLGGCLIFAILMLQQFRNHDYYFLDSFYIPVFLCIVVALSLIPFKASRGFRVFIVVGLVCWLVPVFIFGHRHQSNLYFSDWWERTKRTHLHFASSEQELIKMGISKEAKIMVLDAYSPNLPFIHMKRNGHALVGTRREQVHSALGWEWDYVVVQNDFFLSEVYRNYPEITQRLKYVDNTKELTIFQNDTTAEPKDLTKLLNLQSKNNKITSTWTSTENESPEWYVPTKRKDSTGAVVSNHEYPLIRRIQNKYLPSGMDMHLFFSVKGEINAPNAKLVVTAENTDGSKYYRSFPPVQFQHSQAKEWVIWTTVPSHATVDSDLIFLLFNPDKENLKLNSAQLILYPGQE